MSREIWKDVDEYEGIYQVSSHGRVKRVAPGPSTWPGRLLKPGRNTYGYLHVSLYRDGKEQTVAVHRLVAEAFLERPSPGHNEVNHKNGDKTDNRVENLEWVTCSENHRHAHRVLGRRCVVPDLRGEQHANSKLTRRAVRQIRELYATGEYMQKELAEMFGVSRAAIGYVIRRETWAHIP